MKLETITLQHTRPENGWPDIEKGEVNEDVVYITSSQKDELGEYEVITRDEQTGRIKELRQGEEEFWLSYNPSLERYYVRSKRPELPFRTNLSTSGFRALYFDPLKVMIWLIPRNGTSTLLATILNVLGKRVTPEGGHIWACEGQNECCLNVKEGGLPEPEKWAGYRHCTVYQDPVLKCIRHINHIMTHSRAELYNFFTDNPPLFHNPAAVMDTYLAVAEVNAKNTKESYEQYMMPQMWYHKNFPVTPDTILSLDDLEDFITHEFRMRPVLANIEDSIAFPISAVTPEREEWAERIYGEDRLIPTRFRDRWWKKPEPIVISSNP